MGCRNCCSYCIIGIGVYVLLMTAIMTFGGYRFAVKTAVPISMNFLPFNTSLNLWVEVPLALHITAQLTEATTEKELSNRTLAKGNLGFKIDMESWGDSDGLELFPIVHIQEDSQIDEIQRYLLLLNDGPFNYPKIFSGVVGVVGFVWVFLGFCFILKWKGGRRVSGGP